MTMLVRPLQNESQAVVPDWLAPIVDWLGDHQLVTQLGAILFLVVTLTLIRAMSR